MDCRRGRGSGCSRPGYGISPLWRRSPLTLSQSLQNLPRTGETDSWRAQTKACVHQDPGERSSDPQETDPDLPVSVQESPAEAWVGSGLLQGQGH